MTEATEVEYLTYQYDGRDIVSREQLTDVQLILLLHFSKRTAAQEAGQES